MSDKNKIVEIAGRYTVTGAIGAGATGRVLLARDRATGKTVAIKVLAANLNESESASLIEKFKSEFSIMTKFTHPGICAVYDFGFDEKLGRYFFSTKFVRGRDFIEATRDANVDEIEELIAQVLRALSYLHANGVTHYDIKPANVLVTEDESGKTAKLIDFGLATLGNQDGISGTPTFMAPEVILKENPDARADLYSLGVLWYTAIAGLNPFHAASLSEVVGLQLRHVPEPPSKHNPDVPDYLDDIILKLIAKSPGRRFPGAVQVIKAINYVSGKRYPVETAGTFASYLPERSVLVGRDVQMNKIREQLAGVVAGERDIPFILIIEGEAGSGRKRLLSELKLLAQLGEMNVADISSLENMTSDTTRPTVVTCPGPTGNLEPETVETLKKLCRHIKVKRIVATEDKIPSAMLAFALSPGETPGFLKSLGLDDGDVNRVGVENFERTQVSEYLSATTGIEDPPQKLVDDIFSYTHGNPLFLSEALRALIEQGFLFDKVGRWDRDTIEDVGISLEGLKIPSSLEQVLTNRLKKMDPEERNVLEILSAWKRPVSADELKSISLARPPTGSLVVYNPETSSYCFADTMMERHIYSSINAKRRGKIHDAIAEHLEDPEERNQHLINGSDNRKAIDASIELTDLYLPRTEAREAVTLLENALSRSEKTDNYRRDELLFEMAGTRMALRRYKEAIDTYMELMGSQQCTESASFRMTILQKLGIACLKDRRLADAEKNLRESYELIPESDAAARLSAENLLARWEFLSGNLDGAIDIYERTRKMWRELPEKDGPKVTNNDLGHVLFQKGLLDAAERAIREDLSLFSDIGDAGKLARSHYMLGEIYLARKKYDESSQNLERTVELARGASDLEMLLRTYNSLGNLEQERGNTGSAVSWYQRGLDLAMRGGDEATAAAIAVNAGVILSAGEDFEGAKNYFHSAISLLETAESKSPLELGYLCRSYHELGEIFRMKHLWDESEKYISMAMGIVETNSALTGQKFWILKTKFELARDRKDESQAGKLLGEMKELADSDAKRKAYEDVVTKSPPLCKGRLGGVDPGIPAVLPPLAPPYKGGESDQGEQPMDQKYYKYILEINKYLAVESDLDFVLKTILRYALELSGATAGLILLSDNEDKLSVRASQNLEVDEALSQVSRAIAKKVIADEIIVVTDDAMSDGRFDDAASVMALKLKSVMCLPVSVRKNVIGVVYLENRNRPAAFADVNREILSAFADQAGIAIECARLFSKYETNEKKLENEISQMSGTISRYDHILKEQWSDINRIYKFENLTTRNDKMRDVFDLLGRVADTPLAVCITSESGTGKELIARAVHYNSSRAKGPFVTVNCGALPATLIESELFGYKRGAFTGAVRDKIGFFESADGGTIFLDEIAELDVALQPKLLRVIQEKEIVRVGEVSPRKCNVRVICATNRNIEKLMAEDGFREDLFYRVSEVRVSLPALRERREDIPLLIKELVDEYCVQEGIEKKPSIERSFIRTCLDYDWPGNIRELKNIIRLAVALSGNDKVAVNNLPRDYIAKLCGGSDGTPVTAANDLPLIDKRNQYDPEITWKQYKSYILASAFKRNDMDAAKTADTLGIAQVTAYKKIRELDLRNPNCPLFETSFEYQDGIGMDEYQTKIVRAAWEHADRHSYKAIKTLGISQGLFYTVMKKVGL